jgi:Flp pilus assembly protein TadG
MFDKAKRNRGSAMIEFAVTLPLFLLVLIGMLEYGYYFYVAVTASNAAREGARQCTTVSLGACGACTPSDAVTYMNKIHLGNKTSATAACSNSGGDIMYTVNVTVDFPTLTGYSVLLSALPHSSTSGNTVAYGTAVMRGQ